MAKMYPPYVEPAQGLDTGARGEAYVFQQLSRLPEDWVVIHDYWRYYMAPKSRHINYELDFIVLVPGKGIAVLEVKNWHEAKVEDGEWRFMGRGGKWYSMGRKSSPLHQAYLGCKKLNAELCHVRRFSRWYTDAEHREGKVEFHGMAVLLNQTPDMLPQVGSVARDVADAAENAVPLEHLYICGTEELRHNLQGKIERLFSGAAGGYLPLEAWHMEQIVGYLLPSFHLKGDPAAYNRIMEDASAALHSVLPMLEESEGGISVTGGAGSGKTWIAVREMARLDQLHGASGRRILFLCYNLALAEHVRHLPELEQGVSEGRIAVWGFPAMCQQIAGAFFDDWRQQQRWFAELQTSANSAAVQQVLQKLPEEEWKFDSIFIDECQDFSASWAPIIDRLQREGAKMYYFSDSRQNIFIPNGKTLCPQAPTRIRLRRNLRNSAEIARFSDAILQTEHEVQTLDMPGLEVKVLNATPDPAERARLVRFWVDRLTHGQRDEQRSKVPEDQQNHWLTATPHQVVVLSPYSAYKAPASGEAVRSECCLPLVPGITLRSSEPSTESLIRRWESDPSVLMGITTRSFKGMEADYIILTDVDAPGADHAQTAAEFYIACTRARYGLIIIPKSPEGAAYARQLQEKIKK